MCVVCNDRKFIFDGGRHRACMACNALSASDALWIVRNLGAAARHEVQIDHDDNTDYTGYADEHPSPMAAHDGAGRNREGWSANQGAPTGAEDEPIPVVFGRMRGVVGDRSRRAWRAIAQRGSAVSDWAGAGHSHQRRAVDSTGIRSTREGAGGDSWLREDALCATADSLAVR